MDVDVLVVAALREEFTAAQAAVAVDWEEHDGSAPYVWGRYTSPKGRQLSIALTRPTRMGGRSTGPIATMLVDRLKPSVVAMCGVCAGTPDDTALGDVIVAELVYAYDEGKWTEAGFKGDHRQLAMDPALVRAAQEFTPENLPSFGTANAEDTKLWLLERLLFGQDPRHHPARARYFPDRTWRPSLQRYEDEGLISRPDGAVALTDAGQALVRRSLYDDVDGPERLPFKVFVAPMASGSAVVSDARVWGSLAAMGMRKIAAMEMEGATIATIAMEAKVPQWLVVKGVMDHAGIDKDDRYKSFAATASAEVLFALLDTLPDPDPARPTGTTTTPHRGGKYNVTVGDSEGVQIGDGSTQTNTWR